MKACPACTYDHVDIPKDGRCLNCGKVMATYKQPLNFDEMKDYIKRVSNETCFYYTGESTCASFEEDWKKGKMCVICEAKEIMMYRFNEELS